ncbi:MAG TPA: DUF4382 domain-containing protein [Hanamia sp.]|nr:DUF4382 domain-containing protein [Hanamia sp.]
MKFAKKTPLRFAFLFTFFSIMFFSCKKNAITVNNTSQPRNVSVYLGDDPCQYDSVFIDIKDIELKIDTSSVGRSNDYPGDYYNFHGQDNTWNCGNDHYQDKLHFFKNGIWDTLGIQPGLYNILALRNGNNVIFATGNIPAGTILEMRVSFGPNSYVVVSGVKYSLNLFYNYDNYAYIKIHGNDQDNQSGSGQTSMSLDFNICKSINEFHGKYFLHPFISIYAKDQTGRIEGIVVPHSAQPYVTAWNGTDTASALPEDNGEYMMSGLSAGTYSVMFQGKFGYKDTTLTNVQVTNNTETKLPKITLHQ